MEIVGLLIKTFDLVAGNVLGRRKLLLTVHRARFLFE
jgi:hypothetical protein